MTETVIIDAVLDQGVVVKEHIGMISHKNDFSMILIALGNQIVTQTD